MFLSFIELGVNLVIARNTQLEFSYQYFNKNKSIFGESDR